MAQEEGAKKSSNARICQAMGNGHGRERGESGNLPQDSRTVARHCREKPGASLLRHLVQFSLPGMRSSEG